MFKNWIETPHMMDWCFIKNLLDVTLTIERHQITFILVSRIFERDWLWLYFYVCDQ